MFAQALKLVWIRYLMLIKGGRVSWLTFESLILIGWLLCTKFVPDYRVVFMLLSITTHLFAPLASSLASISMLTMWTHCTQVSRQPFWDADGHAVHDQCSLRPVPAATVHTDGGTSAWRSLLGTKLANKTSDSGWRFHSGTDVCSCFNRST